MEVLVKLGGLVCIEGRSQTEAEHSVQEIRLEKHHIGSDKPWESITPSMGGNVGFVQIGLNISSSDHNN